MAAYEVTVPGDDDNVRPPLHQLPEAGEQPDALGDVVGADTRLQSYCSDRGCRPFVHHLKKRAAPTGAGFASRPAGKMEPIQPSRIRLCPAWSLAARVWPPWT